jgi:hypothetical protein
MLEAIDPSKLCYRVEMTHSDSESTKKYKILVNDVLVGEFNNKEDAECAVTALNFKMLLKESANPTAKAFVSELGSFLDSISCT